jgi:hypothetical protein
VKNLVYHQDNLIELKRNTNKKHLNPLVLKTLGLFFFNFFAIQLELLLTNIRIHQLNGENLVYFKINFFPYHILKDNYVLLF